MPGGPCIPKEQICVPGFKAPSSHFRSSGTLSVFYPLDWWAEFCEVSFRRVSHKPLRNSRLLIEDFHCTSQCTDLYPSLPTGLCWGKRGRVDAFPLLSPKSLNSKNKKHKEWILAVLPVTPAMQVCMSWKLFDCCVLLGGQVSNGSRMMPFPSGISSASCNHPDLSSLLCF